MKTIDELARGQIDETKNFGNMYYPGLQAIPNLLNSITLSIKILRKFKSFRVIFQETDIESFATTMIALFQHIHSVNKQQETFQQVCISDFHDSISSLYLFLNEQQRNYQSWPIETFTNRKILDDCLKLIQLTIKRGNFVLKIISIQ